MSFFYPRRCPFCDRALRVGEEGACPACRGSLEYVREPKCKRCGKPLEEEAEYCGDCDGSDFSFEYGHALYVYQGRVRDALSRLKYHDRREYARFFAEELYREYGDWMRGLGDTCLIAVPLHWKRYRKRGYNQAALIAGELGRVSGIPVCERGLVRCRNTAPQKELSREERRRNLFQAFQAKNLGEELNHIPECVILIDDIYTTGSTLDACAEALRENRVKKVYFLCIGIGRGF